MQTEIEKEIQKAELARMQKKNELLGLEIELQKVIVEREKLSLAKEKGRFSQ